MPTTTFQNGQVQTSTALTDSQMQVIFQILTCQMLGLVAGLKLWCNLIQNTNQILAPLVKANIENGFITEGNGIPDGTVITNIVGSGESFLITLSNNATINTSELVSFFDPAYNTRVRTSWQQQGSPGFGIDDDVLFLQCVLESNRYNIRDQQWVNDPDDANQLLKYTYYTRRWRVRFVAYGPNAFDSLRLVSSMLLEDFPHDTLAASNIYLEPDPDSPIRNPELFESQWWERVDFGATFNEEVTESITKPKVASIKVIGSTSDDQTFETVIQGV